MTLDEEDISFLVGIDKNNGSFITRSIWLKHHFVAKLGTVWFTKSFIIRFYIYIYIYIYINIYIRVSWKVHWLTRIVTRDVTKWDLYFKIVFLAVNSLLSVLHCFDPSGKKSKTSISDRISSYKPSSSLSYIYIYINIYIYILLILYF